MKGSTRPSGYERGEVGDAPESHAVHDLDEATMVDDPAVSSPASGRIGPTHLLLGCQGDLQGEPGMADQLREAHELVEHVDDRSALRRPPRRDGPVIGLPDDRPGDRHRDDEEHVAFLDQREDLAPHRREMPGLDLDDEVATEDVDDVPPDPCLQAIARARVGLLQGAVERLLVQGADQARRQVSTREAGYASGRIAIGSWPRCCPDRSP